MSTLFPPSSHTRTIVWENPTFPLPEDLRNFNFYPNSHGHKVFSYRGDILLQGSLTKAMNRYESYRRHTIQTVTIVFS